MNILFKQDDPRHQKVLKIAEMFAIYRAELARILHVRCDDIGALETGSFDLSLTTDSGRQAGRWLMFFDYLYHKMNGDEVRMCHWLRAPHGQLNNSPLLHMVDHDGLSEVILLLQPMINDYKIEILASDVKAIVNFRGLYQGEDVHWRMTLFTLKHYQQQYPDSEPIENQQLMVVEPIVDDYYHIIVALSVASIDQPTIRNAVLMVRNYKGLHDGWHHWQGVKSD